LRHIHDGYRAKKKAASRRTRPKVIGYNGAKSILGLIGQEGDVTRTLDGAGEFALEAGGNAGDARRKDLAARGEEALEVIPNGEYDYFMREQKGVITAPRGYCGSRCHDC
jgi:hypothetical protein